MTTPTSDPISEAAGLLRRGDKLGARRLLFGFVRQNPNSEQGWLVLGMTMDDPNQQAECFRRVLSINPNNAQARQKLEQANTAPAGETLRQTLGTERKPPPPAANFNANQFYTDAPAQAETSFDAHAQPNQQYAQPSASSAAAKAEPAPAPSDEAAPKEPEKPAQEKKTKKRKKKANRWLVLAAIFVPVFCLIGVGGGWVLMQMSGTTAPAQPPALPPTATVIPSATPFRMPPTWTPTPGPTNTPYMSPTPVSPTPTSTLQPPAPPNAAAMERIQKEVSDLRGLPILEPVESYLVTRDKAEVFLRGMLVTDDLVQELKSEARSLSALGLIKPTYDLVNYAINGVADGLGGVYISWTRQLLVIMTYAFTGMEHLIYAHEFDHALTDQHFDMDALGVYPECLSNEQRCTAIRALVEGDATLLMYQWLEQYATPADARDLMLYTPPAMLLPEQSPPPFVEHDLNFPYEYGQVFVKYLYDRGNWPAVNQAYQNLPASTEQIIHPEKYIAGEMPIEIVDPTLEGVLGPEWTAVKQDSLGEWTTFLILAYNADIEAQIDAEISKAAAAGWGGDHFQVYAGPNDQTVLAVHWAWDTPQDNQEFLLALNESVERRFHKSKIDSPAGICWQVEPETSCIFNTDFETLWLIAPNLDTIEQLRALYPSFK